MFSRLSSYHVIERSLSSLTRLAHTSASYSPNNLPSSKSSKRKKSENSEKSYASTLFLPKTAFPIFVEPRTVRKKYQQRTTEDLYAWQEKVLSDPAFILHDGPPYANGHLHCGHALNKILKDVILRYQILQGRKVNYVPGWDCHGLPVENKALEKLNAEPNSLSSVIVRDAARQTAEEAIEIQKEEMSYFGLVGNWDSAGTYRTMDSSFEARQLDIFAQMLKNGIIYRQFRPVYWSPSSQTALAEAELVYEMHTSSSAYVGFTVDPSSLTAPLKELSRGNEVRLVVWTTTPWTLPMNQAISIHPDMEYSLIQKEGREGLLVVATLRLDALKKVLGEYTVVGTLRGQEMVGLSYKPLFGNRSINHPVILTKNVLDNAGTGIIHMAPAHGHEDYQAFLTHGLLQNNPLISIIDSNGRYTRAVEDIWGNASGSRLVGLDVFGRGNKEVLSLLEGDGGSLLGVEKYRHRYPYDWRTGKPLIIRATAQWFANLEGIKEKAMKALESVEFYPPISRNRLEAFVRDRGEWCISRQRSWGVPIPSLHVTGTDEAVLTQETLQHILPILKRKGTSYWWSGPVEEFIPPSLATKYPPGALAKGTDTIDVWFDSGTSWSMLPKGVADVCLEGSDQHRGWFQSSLLTAVAAMEDRHSKPKAPFTRVITHGFVLDEKGKKMSKSLGNVISPVVVVNGGPNLKHEPEYGTDVLRLWALSTQYSNDVAIGKVALKQASEVLRKLRMTLRFLMGSLGDSMDAQGVAGVELSLLDRYVLHELWMLERDSKRAYDVFSFHEVVTSISHFINVTLSSLYFDISKDTLYADPATSQSRLGTLYVLQSVFQTMLPIIAPLTPYLAEEVHQIIFPNSSASVFTRQWHTASDSWKNERAHREMLTLLRLRKIVIELLEMARMEKKIRSSLEADVLLTFPDGTPKTSFAQLVYSQEGLLRKLFIVSDVSLDNDQAPVYDQDWAYSESFPVPDTEECMRVSVRAAKRLKCPRCWSYTRKTEEAICGRCQHTLTLAA